MRYPVPCSISLGVENYTVKTDVNGMKVNQGKSLIWFFLKIPLWTTISMESSRQDLYIDMVVDMFTLKNKTTLPVYYIHTLNWYPKQGLVFTVY